MMPGLTPQHVPKHPGPSSEQISARMSVARRRDTAPELALRHALHAAGLRFRVHYPVPGQRRRTIDIAFTRARVAVFVDGCFWHGCPEHGTRPSQNTDWWQTKIGANRDRDANTNSVLSDAGWVVVRVWEHEAAWSAASRVADLVLSRRTSGSSND
jgi:DNA mismatch endonuclease (patch repair protein)